MHRSFFEIWRHIGRKLPRKTYPTLIWHVPSGWPLVNFSTSHTLPESRIMGAIRRCKFHDPAFALLDTIPACDGQTDRRTDTSLPQRPRYAQRRAGKNVKCKMSVCSSRCITRAGHRADMACVLAPGRLKGQSASRWWAPTQRTLDCAELVGAYARGPAFSWVHRQHYPAICLREKAIFVTAQKCPYHVTFDLDLEHTLDAGLPGDHRVQVRWRFGHCLRARWEL